MNCLVALCVEAGSWIAKTFNYIMQYPNPVGLGNVSSDMPGYVKALSKNV